MSKSYLLFQNREQEKESSEGENMLCNETGVSGEKVVSLAEQQDDLDQHLLCCLLHDLFWHCFPFSV
jgi:hypothetical protein